MRRIKKCWQRLIKLNAQPWMPPGSGTVDPLCPLLLSVPAGRWGSHYRWGSKSSEMPRVHTVTKWGVEFEPLSGYERSHPLWKSVASHTLCLDVASFFITLRSRVAQTAQPHPREAAWPVRFYHRPAADGVTLHFLFGAQMLKAVCSAAARPVQSHFEYLTTPSEGLPR